MIASLVGELSVAAGLLDYLQARLGLSDLEYLEPPTQITVGWEQYIYRFRLRPTAGLPPEFADRLVLRVYSSIEGRPWARQEFAALKAAHALGYPVPRLLALEESGEPFGGPFLLMECVPGHTLLDELTARPWRIWDLPDMLAEAHARLHQLPPDGFPHAPEPFLERRLEEMRATIRDFELYGMRSGLDWLARHRPAPPATPRIIHLDFHPINVLVDEGRFRAVLDWNDSDVGDPHADVAVTLLLIRSAPVDVPALWHRLISPLVRLMLRRRYLRAYRRRLPLDPDRLAYYFAWAAFRRLLRWDMWLHATPRVTGSKPSAMRYLCPEQVNFVRDSFHRWAGVAVRL
jgi:aminoglycoside phosphotransferase (APT) family kinase protein